MLETLSRMELNIKTPQLPWGRNAKLLPLTADFEQPLLYSDSVFQRKRATLDNFGVLEEVIELCGMDMHKVAAFYGYGDAKYATRGLYNWLHKNGALPALYIAMGNAIDTINDHILDMRLAALPMFGGNFDRFIHTAQFNITVSPLAGLSKKQCLHIRRKINEQRNECVGRRLEYGWNAPPPPPKTKVDIRITY